MRTTVNINDRLLAQAREIATRTRRPLGDVVDDALRELFSTKDESREPVRLTTFDGGGVRPGVDLNDNAGLRDLMDEDDEDEQGPGRATG